MKTARRIITALLVAGLVGGCDSLQRKFIRKPKNVTPPTPIVHFKPYEPTQSAEELYKHHLMLWEFWNGELVGGFGVSEKKIQHASKETLAELLELQRFLPEPKAQQLQKLIDEHRQLDARIQSGYLNDATEQTLKRHFEYQQRAVTRDFSWRDVKDLARIPDRDAPPPGDSTPQTPGTSP